MTKTTNDNQEAVQQEALDQAIHHRFCTLGISVGVGKTKIALDYLNQCYTNPSLKFLIVIPKLSLIKNWQHEINKFGHHALLDAVEFVTYASLPKYFMGVYQVVILDECHNLTMRHEPVLKDIHQFNIRLLGLTGTVPNTRSSKYELIDQYLPVRYEYQVEEAVDMGILNDYQIHVHLLSLGTSNNIEVKTKNNGVFYTSERANYQFWCKKLEEASRPKDKQMAAIMRMKALMGFKTKERFTKELLSTLSEKTIVFANTQEQADRLCMHSVHSDNQQSEDNLQDFKEGLVNQLSCVLQISEGVTIPGLTTGIIMHSYGNERKFMQRFGRLLRLDPDQVAQMHVLCYKNTIEHSKWLPEALSDFDPQKIFYIDHTSPSN